MSQKFKDQEQDEQKESGLDYQIPDTKSLSQKLAEAGVAAARQEHIELTKQEEEEEKKTGKKKERKQKQGGTICFCLNPACGIGEFIQKE